MNHLTKPIHVAHIASGDLWAGAEVQLLTLCKSLHRMNDVSVSVILLNHGTLEKKLREQDIPVTILDETRLNGFQITKYLYWTLKKNRPDIVHTHRQKENILGSLAAKMTGTPSLRTAHGASEHAIGWLRLHKSLFYLLDWFTGCFIQTAIIAVSEELKTALANKYPKKKLKVIENGVDLEALTPFYKSPEKKIKLKGPYKIGLVGRLVQVKRVDLFIRTAKYLRKYHPEILAHFHIYGDGPLRTELENLATMLKIEDIVHFEGHCDDIHQQIASLDVLLITSDHEGLPMTLLEAMALGTPVIAHSIGGITKACDNGKACLLSKNNAVQLFAEKLLQLLSDPNIYSSKNKHALNYIKNNYSAFLNADKYQDFYKHLLVVANS